MTRPIFRRAALDRLASPEQLDRSLRIVSPVGWLALSALAVSLGVTIVWSAFAHAPVKVAARGIFIDPDGVFEIVASRPGRLEALTLLPGSTVARGEVVGRLAQPELAHELAEGRADLADARQRLAELERFYAALQRREAQDEARRLATIESVRERVQARLVLLEEQARAIAVLRADGIVTSDRVIESQLTRSQAQERLSALADERETLRLARTDRQRARELELLDERVKVADLERKVARLAAELDERRAVISAHDGVVTEVKVRTGDVVAPGMALATVVPAQAGEKDALSAVLYVAPEDGKRIRPGMAAELRPATVHVERHGFLLGTVERVSPLPASREGMRSVLRNDRLAEQLAGEGAPFEVRVRPLRDAMTPSGYRWSSGRGPAMRLHAGTLTDGRLVVERVPVLSLAIPALDRGGDGDAERADPPP